MAINYDKLPDDWEGQPTHLTLIYDHCIEVIPGPEVGRIYRNPVGTYYLITGYRRINSRQYQHKYKEFCFRITNRHPMFDRRRVYLFESIN